MNRPAHKSRRWLPWLLLAVAVVVTGAMYWPGVTGGWVFDDYPNIVDNTALHLTTFPTSLGTWINIALSSPSSFLHRPLSSITFALNWLQGGGNPYPFKVTNILIHLLNGVLVFCMLRALFRVMGLRGVRGATVNAEPSPALRAPSPDGRGERRDGISPTPSVDPLPKDGGELRRGDIPPTQSVDPLPAEGGEQQGVDPIHAEGGKQHPPSRGRAERERTRAKRDEEDGSRWHLDDATATRLALLVAAAWMLSPINLMAVLYVVQRMESLCQVFVLAGLWAYLHGRWLMLTANGDARRDARGLSLATAGIVLGTAIGLTSKETAVLLPVFAFLAEAILMRFRRGVVCAASPSPADAAPKEGANDGPASERKRGGAGTRTDKRIWALFVVTLFAPAVFGGVWLLRQALNPVSWVGRTFTLGQRLLTEARVLVDYLHWTLLPNPDVLSLYHDEIVKSTGWLTPWTTLGSIVLLAALIVVAVLLRNRRPLVSLGIGWFFAGNLLTATIIPLELVYEQRMYFPTIGVLLAAGALLIGRRWKIPHALPRVFVAAVALVWFATATNLRAQEWSNPIRLAVAEAGRHPESPRAVYEAGRLLLIASDYRKGPMLTASRKYLQQAADIPGSSALPDQALIMIADHDHHGDDARLWQGIIAKLARQPTKQEDISALISLTNCYGAGICKFNPHNLQQAYLATLSRPHPIPRLNGAYADFQRDILHNDVLATKYLARAVKGDPSEPAYRVDLSALYARQGETEKALEQIDALERMNYAGRLTRQIDVLRRLAEQGKTPAASASE
ncbi:MAG TPA: hypothetical protein VF292_07260 [Rhodanobacteraceae bacterium]